MDVLGSAWGALGAFLWALGTSLGMFRGSLGGRWVSWGCSCDALGGPKASLGGSWVSLGGPWRFLVSLRQLLGRRGGRPRAPYDMHTDVSAFLMFYYTCVCFCFFHVLVVCTRTKVMYTTCFSVFGSVFTRRGAAPGVSLGDSLADSVGDLGPHMLCTPMFQRFSLFSAECVLGGSLGRPWGCLWDPQGFLVGPRGILGAAWGSLETP